MGVSRRKGSFALRFADYTHIPVPVRRLLAIGVAFSLSVILAPVALAAWPAPTLLQSNAGNTTQVATVIDPSGVATALWVADDPTTGQTTIRASRYAGGAWSAAQTLSDPTVQAASPALAVDPNGVVTAIWASGAPLVLIQSSRFENGSWSSPPTVNPGSVTAKQSLAVVADSRGVVTAIWATIPTSAALEASRYANGAWSDITGSLPATDVRGSSPRLVVDGAGIATAIWARRTTESAASAANRVYVGRHTGSGWEITLLSDATTTSGAGNPELAVSGSGVVTAAWALEGVQVKRYEGGIWSAASTTLTDPSIAITRLGVAVDERGLPTVVWEEPVDVKSRRFDGSSWSAEETLATDPSGGVPGMILAGAPNGRMTVLWTATDLPNNYYIPAARRFEGSAWGATAELEDRSSFPTTVKTAAMNSCGGAVAVWGNESGGGSPVYPVYASVDPPDAEPTAPTGPAATAGLLRATVTWTAASASASCPVTGYTVTVIPGGATCSTTETSCDFTGLLNTRAYRFAVTATNATGTGAASAETAAVRPYKRLSMRKPRAAGTRIASKVRLTSAATITQTVRTSTGRVACQKRVLVKRVRKARTYAVTCPLNRATRTALRKRAQTLVITTAVFTTKGASLQTTHRLRVRRTR
ncbi:MAG: fibronectin type III domain-containing protein [Planctomycetota bacterium]